MEYEKYIDLIPVNYTDDELEEISKILDKENNQLINEYADEIAKLNQDKTFDEYSFRGQRKINKITDKYADMCADISIIKEDIAKEQEKRDEYYEQQRYMGTGKYKKIEETTTEEFLEKETEKTRRHRFFIDKDD